MNTSPGEKYVESGKIDSGRLIVSSLLILIVNGLLGVAYGSLSHLNPLIYINILILIGALIVALALTGAIQVFSHCRNKTVFMFVITLGALYFIYSAWGATIGMESHRYDVWSGMLFKIPVGEIFDYMGSVSMNVGKIGRSGLPISSEIMTIFYFIEAGLVIGFPLFIVGKQSHYFCEACMISYDSFVMYFTRINHERFESVSRGNLEELKNETAMSEKQLEQLAGGIPVSKIEIHFCKKCKTAIADVELGKAEKKDKKYEFKSDSSLVAYKGIYLDQKTSELLIPVENN